MKRNLIVFTIDSLLLEKFVLLHLINMPHIKDILVSLQCNDQQWKL